MKQKLTIMAVVMAVLIPFWSVQGGYNPHITWLDLDIDGVADDKEFDGPGGFVPCDGWKKITLCYEGVNDPMKLRLNWNSDKIAVYTADGETIENGKIWDPASDMPGELWVKGLQASDTGPTDTASGPEHMCLEAINNGEPADDVPSYLHDRIGLTILQVDVEVELKDEEPDTDPRANDRDASDLDMSTLSVTMNGEIVPASFMTISDISLGSIIVGKKLNFRAPGLMLNCPGNNEVKANISDKAGNAMDEVTQSFSLP